MALAVERWSALMKSNLPALDGATLVRASLAALSVAALLWLVRMLVQRRPREGYFNE